MNTICYFVLFGRYNSGSPLLIKFDDTRQYWWWDRHGQDWIVGNTTFFEEHWLNAHLKSVVEEEGKRLIDKEVIF